MKQYGIAATAALAALTGAAQAGGLDRSDSPLSIAPLFENGAYAEFGFRFVSPRESGVGGPATGASGISSGQILDDYVNLSGAYKNDINDRFSYALSWNNPTALTRHIPCPTTQAAALSRT